ncbi:MAG TPA: cytochrome-c peroxidase [Flavobacterium sp.]|nr:cytochrome-c peroxidase [Flavobacterium sp.]
MKGRVLHSAILGLACLGCIAFANRKTTPIYFSIPKNWPKPQYDFAQNPLTEEGFQLGRQLFYDPILSKDNTISCASCHLQATGFTHVDHALSHGIDGKIGTRNSLALVNLAWSKNFMWDGGVNHLDMQPLNPITSSVEMDETLERVAYKLQQIPKYQRLFTDAFGDSGVTGQRILKALSQFELLLVSCNSRYDRVTRGEAQFTEREQKGYALFQSHCASCHKEPLFTSDTFEYNGLAIDTTLNDNGRFKITQENRDKLRFKVPSLRNVQFTFPYMHNGRFKTLTEVVKHYNTLGDDKQLPKPLGTPLDLSDNERTDLVLFLKTLTDNDFLSNPKFSFPRE